MLEFEYRKATPDDLEAIWNMNIADNPCDDRWERWKREYISYNRSGMAATFVVVADGVPVGEGTLLLSQECKAVGGREWLSDNKTVANVNALRIIKQYEGKGHISKHVRLMEKYAYDNGYKKLSIGVEEKETRNRAIYLHWGFDKLLCATVEDGESVFYYSKQLF